MQLTSPSFEYGQPIPARYTCKGDNISPPLSIANIPVEAQGLVLIVHDPDAPRGDWLHWTVWNIDPEVDEISENTVPQGGIEGVTDFDKPGWGGPCPPSGIHRYMFDLYALSTPLDVPAGASLGELQEAMQGKIIEQTQLIGTFSA